MTNQKTTELLNAVLQKKKIQIKNKKNEWENIEIDSNLTVHQLIEMFENFESRIKPEFKIVPRGRAVLRYKYEVVVTNDIYTLKEVNKMFPNYLEFVGFIHPVEMEEEEVE